MKWAELHTGIFNNPGVNTGRQVTMQEVLMMDYKKDHETFNCYQWFLEKDPDEKRRLRNDVWIANDQDTINDLRTQVINKEEKLALKSTLQCWQPSCFMPDKSKGKKPETVNPILCMDMDHLEDWDTASLKQAIFDLPFVCMVSSSCSGNGIYALILIEEPDRLKEYAEHCYRVFQSYGLPIDTSKGRNYNDLRFVSYDPEMLYRDNPEPLRIKHFNAPKIDLNSKRIVTTIGDSPGVIKWAIKEIQNAQVGQRWPTIQKVSYTLGGHNAGLEEIKQAITYSNQYTGVEAKYLQCAEVCFKDGFNKPLTINT